MKKTFFDTLYKLAEEDKRVMFIKADTAYVPDFQKAFPKQYLDVGIAEQNMIGIAAGMALEGKIPFTYSIVNFSSMRCLEQIRNDIAYHKLNAKIVSCGAGFDYGYLGATHHATEDLGIMRGMPNMIVFSPCDSYEVISIMNSVLSIDGPCFIRIGHGGEKILHKNPIQDFKIGKAYQLVMGKDVSIFATGSITEEAVMAARELNSKGYDVGVYSFPTIKPIDKELIMKCANQSRLIITVEEHNIIGGLGSAVAEVLAEMPSRGAILKRIGVQDVFTMIIGDRTFLKKTYHMDMNAIIDIIRNS